jgi:hypothetical protein
MAQEPFYEIRRERLKPGAHDEFVRLMDKEVIPLHKSVGMDVVGSFVDPTQMDLFIWIRRFRSDDERATQVAAVHATDSWRVSLSSRVRDLVLSEKSSVERLIPTAASRLT